jgi:hypothetical protein
MDFLRFFRSLEELLYEVMTWLLFYPSTFWRVVSRPFSLAVIEEPGPDEDFEDRFPDLVSPPLFLILSILLAHIFELATHTAVARYGSGLARTIMSSDNNLLIFRTLFFSLFPLLMAAGLLRRQGLPVDRKTLRQPFFVQCYFAAPFAVVFSGAMALFRLPNVTVHFAGLALALAAVAWYLGVETGWFRTRLGVGRLRAFGAVMKLFVFGCGLGLLIALVVVVPG